MSQKFAALKDLDTEVYINSAWETIRENTKFEPNIGYYQLKKDKP
jgi:hypothetical protein